MKCYGFPEEAQAYYSKSDLLWRAPLRFEQLFARLYYLGPLREYPKRQYVWGGSRPSDVGRRGERVVDAPLAAASEAEAVVNGRGERRQTLEEVVASWLKKLGLVCSFQVRPVAEGSHLYRVHVQRFAGGPEVLLSDIGFGISQILPVLTLCYYVPVGSIIILEHPEIHLHPVVQAGLADVFIDAIKTRNVQIILESHSEHLLRRLQQRIAEEEIVSSSAALYFCSVDQTGASNLLPLEVDTFGNIANWLTHFFGDELGELVAMMHAEMKRRKVDVPA